MLPKKKLIFIVKITVANASDNNYEMDGDGGLVRLLSGFLPKLAEFCLVSWSKLYPAYYFSWIVQILIYTVT